jgi:hypothetical protein
MSTAGALSTCFVEPGVGMLRMTKVLDGSRRAAYESSSSSSSSGTSSRRPQQQQQLEENLNMSETCTKAAAWAVFQHHGGGGGAAAAAAAATNYSYRQCYGIAVRRATRFKIEAQMKNGGGGGVHHHHHHAAMPASSTVCNSDGVFMNKLHQWDAGSTLFDSYELDALSKQFDRAFQLLPSSSSSSSSYGPEQQQQQQHHHHPPGAAARLQAYIDESHLALDTTRITSPLSPQQWHQDERVLLPAASESSWNNMQLDCVEEEFYTRRETLQQQEQQHRFFFQPCGATAAIIQPPAAAAGDDTTSDGGNNTAEEESTTFEEPVELETSLKLGQKLHGPFQFAIHTPNPLNLSQRNARSSMDKSSHDTDHRARRQSFQEKLRSFFHKARISPQSESSSPGAASSSHHSISRSSRDHSLNRPPRGGRKLSYTATTAASPQEDSLLSNHDGWGYVDDQTHAWSDELLLKPPPVVVVAGKHRKSGSFSLRSVTKALQNSLPHLGISESQRQRSQSTSDIHQQLQWQQELQQQHHHVYNHHHHHHHHVVIEQQQKQQQQQAEDYELTLQDIDRRVPRKSIEEKTRRISFEDAAGNNNFNKVHRNSLEEEKREQHSMTNSSDSEQNQVHHHSIFA